MNTLPTLTIVCLLGVPLLQTVSGGAQPATKVAAGGGHRQLLKGDTGSGGNATNPTLAPDATVIAHSNNLILPPTNSGAASGLKHNGTVPSGTPSSSSAFGTNGWAGLAFAERGNTNGSIYFIFSHDGVDWLCNTNDVVWSSPTNGTRDPALVPDSTGTNFYICYTSDIGETTTGYVAIAIIKVSASVKNGVVNLASNYVAYISAVNIDAANPDLHIVTATAPNFLPNDPTRLVLYATTNFAGPYETILLQASDTTWAKYTATWINTNSTGYDPCPFINSANGSNYIADTTGLWRSSSWTGTWTPIPANSQNGCPIGGEDSTLVQMPNGVVRWYLGLHIAEGFPGLLYACTTNIDSGLWSSYYLAPFASQLVAAPSYVNMPGTVYPNGTFMFTTTNPIFIALANQEITSAVLDTSWFALFNSTSGGAQSGQTDTNHLYVLPTANATPTNLLASPYTWNPAVAYVNLNNMYVTGAYTNPANGFILYDGYEWDAFVGKPNYNVFNLNVAFMVNYYGYGFQCPTNAYFNFGQQGASGNFSVVYGLNSGHSGGGHSSPVIQAPPVPAQMVAGGVTAIAAGALPGPLLRNDGADNNINQPGQIAVEPGYNQISLRLLSGGDVLLSFVGIAGANYALDRSASLSPANWVPQATNPAGAGGVLVFTNKPDPATYNFWRVRSVP